MKTYLNLEEQCSALEAKDQASGAALAKGQNLQEHS